MTKKESLGFCLHWAFFATLVLVFAAKHNQGSFLFPIVVYLVVIFLGCLAALLWSCRSGICWFVQLWFEGDQADRDSVEY